MTVSRRIGSTRGNNNRKRMKGKQRVKRQNYFMDSDRWVWGDGDERSEERCERSEVEMY